MSNKVKNILIGVFVIIAIFSVIYLILFLEPKIGDGGKTLRVRFSNIASINVGTRVTLAGKPVGEVVAITKVKDSREGLTDILGRIYFYQLTLKVDSSVEIFNTDEITIATTGLLGEKSIAIIPKSPKKGVIPKNISNQIIYAQSVEALENIVYQVSTLADKMEDAFGHFDIWFVENQEELSNSVKSFASAMHEIDTMVDSINKTKLITSLKNSMNLFSKNMNLMQNSLEEIQDKEMIAKFNVILENFAEVSEYISSDGPQILTNVNKITKDIAQGNGTLGKLIKNDDFYLRTISVLSKVDTLMNDVNHYGLLFQYDKHWQRIRTKRANLLQNLSTPKEFKSYFENEVDTITTSLSRLSILMQKSEEKEQILSTSKFQKNFLDLLRQVEHLLDTLKLYNEEITDIKPICDKAK